MRDVLLVTVDSLRPNEPVTVARYPLLRVEVMDRFDYVLDFVFGDVRPVGKS